MTTTPTPAPDAETRHRRAAVLRSVKARIEDDPTGELPWDEDTAAVYADRDDLLRAVHSSWSRRLAAVVDTALELDDADVETAVARAWRRTANQMPGIRALLDRHAGEPAVQHQELVDHRTVAVAAGLATLTDPWEHSAAVGRRLVQKPRGPAAARTRRRRFLGIPLLTAKLG